MNISADLLYLKLSQPEFCQKFFSHENILNLNKNSSYQFNNISLFIESLTHQSFVNEYHGFKLKNYERLEHLGDQVIGLLVTQELFKRYPEENEGKLSTLRSAMVNSSTLASLSLKLGLDSVVLLGKGELENKGYLQTSLLGDLFESYFGAIYIDSKEDLKTCESVLNFILKDKDSFYEIDKNQSMNHKTRLQELTYQKLKTRPEYIVKEQEHKGISGFKVDLKIEGKSIVSLWNESKKRGMQLAAKKVIEENLI